MKYLMTMIDDRFNKLDSRIDSQGSSINALSSSMAAMKESFTHKLKAQDEKMEKEKLAFQKKHGPHHEGLGGAPRGSSSRCLGCCSVPESGDFSTGHRFGLRRIRCPAANFRPARHQDIDIFPPYSLDLVSSEYPGPLRHEPVQNLGAGIPP
jgi:hypothetical protein